MRLGLVSSLLLTLCVSTTASQATPLPLTQNLAGSDWEMTVITSDIATDPVTRATVRVDFDLLWHGSLDSYAFADSFRLYEYDYGIPLPEDWPGWDAEVANLNSTLQVTLHAPGNAQGGGWTVSFSYLSPEPQAVPEPGAALIFAIGLLGIRARPAADSRARPSQNGRDRPVAPKRVLRGSPGPIRACNQ